MRNGLGDVKLEDPASPAGTDVRLDAGRRGAAGPRRPVEGNDPFRSSYLLRRLRAMPARSRMLRVEGSGD